ncbi:hypothetical protein [Dactylosporangium sp. CS-033363]|uniref:hypothetical protein n=1 Tax=Dactylosporangium sp. CS-033363 TaxID=3239935 RepID=UPI003D918551
MADLLTAPPAPVTAARRAGHGWAMVALARAEAVRLVRHPLTIVAVGLFLAPWVYGLVSGSADGFPVLPDAAVDLQVVAVFALGSGALMTANLAVLRGHRHRTEEFDGTLVLPPAWRVGAVLLALVPYALVVTLLAGVRLGVLALLPGAVGRPDPFEVLTTPVVVVLFGVVGVLLGRLARSAVAAPLVLVLIVVSMFAALAAGALGRPWLLGLTPITPLDRSYPLPAALVDRASGRHLLYVAGLVAVVALLALARSGARRVLVPLGVAVAVTAVAGVVQFRADPGVQRLRAEVTRDPAPVENCRQVGDARYCALGEFEAWIPSWASVVAGVTRPAPAVAGPALVVRQRVWLVGRPDATGSFTSSATADEERVAGWQDADAAAGFAEAVTIGADWGPDRAAATFAGAVAYRVMTGTALATQQPICGARGALLIWLVGQATPAAARGLRAADDSSWGAVTLSDESLLTSIAVPDRDAAPALTLLTRPVDATTAVVRAHWAELTAADTTLERFGELLGVPVPAAPPAEERMTCAA